MNTEKDAPTAGEAGRGAQESGEAPAQYNTATAEQKLTIDLEQIREFCEAMFANVTEAGYVQLRCFRDDADDTALTPWPAAKVNPAAEEPTAELAEVAGRMAQRAADALNPVVFAPPVVLLDNPKKAAETHVSQGVALSVDLDRGNPAKDLQRLESIIGNGATSVDHSGGYLCDTETGEELEKLHAHWRLSEPTRTEEDHAKLKRARKLANHIIGGDTTNNPLVHPIRWPGSWHRKRGAVMSTIKKLDFAAENDLDEALAGLEQAAAQVVRPESDIDRAEDDTSRKQASEYIALQDQIRKGEAYHVPLIRIASKRAANGLHEGAILEELEALMHQSETPRDARWQGHFDDLPRTVRGAMKFKPESEADISGLFKWLEDTEPTEGKPKAPGFDLKSARVGDLLDSDPPPRRWLIDQRLPLDVVGLLAAAGGTGKSMATLQLAVSVATGLPWLDMPVGETGEVVIFSAEDDRGEVHRRLNCVVQEVVDSVDPFDPAPAEQHRQALKERLFIFDCVGADNRMTHKVNGEIQRTLFANYVIEAVSQLDNCKLIVLDPLSRFDGGEPNDNADGTRLIEAAEYIRRHTGATVLLPHHVSKASMKDSDAGQEAVRGASGLVDGARWVGVLAGLRKDEAKQYGVDEDDAGRYVRFTTPKANYSAPWEGCWLERQAGGVLVASELKLTKEDHKERKAEQRYRAIVAGAEQLIHKHGPMSARHLRIEYGGAEGVMGAGEKAIRGALAKAVECGELVERECSDGRTTLLEIPETPYGLTG